MRRRRRSIHERDVLGHGGPQRPSLPAHLRAREAAKGSRRIPDRVVVPRRLVPSPGRAVRQHRGCSPRRVRLAAVGRCARRDRGRAPELAARAPRRRAPRRHDALDDAGRGRRSRPGAPGAREAPLGAAAALRRSSASRRANRAHAGQRARDRVRRRGRGPPSRDARRDVRRARWISRSHRVQADGRGERRARPRAGRAVPAHAEALVRALGQAGRPTLHADAARDVALDDRGRRPCRAHAPSGAQTDGAVGNAPRGRATDGAARPVPGVPDGGGL